MLNKLPSECLFEIIEFLYNHEIMNILTLNKKINQLLPVNRIEEYMSYRVHPLVFNKHDNYCVVCNQGLIFYNEEEKIENIICNHK